MARITQYRRVLNSATRINNHIAGEFGRAIVSIDPLEVQMNIIDKIASATDEEVAHGINDIIEGIALEHFEYIEMPRARIGIGSIVLFKPQKWLGIVHSIYSMTAPGADGTREPIYNIVSLTHLGRTHGLLSTTGRDNAQGVNHELSRIHLSDLVAIKLIVGEEKTKRYNVVDERGRMICTFRNKPEKDVRFTGNYIMLNGRQFKVEGTPMIHTVSDVLTRNAHVSLSGKRRMHLLQESIAERRNIQHAIAGHAFFQMSNIIRDLQQQLSGTDDETTHIFGSDAERMMEVVREGWRHAQEREARLYSHFFLVSDTGQFGTDVGSVQIAIPYIYQPVRVVDDMDTIPIPENIRTRMKRETLIMFKFIRTRRQLKLALRGLYYKQHIDNGRQRYFPFPHYHWHSNGDMCWGSCPTTFAPDSLISSTDRQREAVAFRRYLLELAHALETVNANSPTEAMPNGLPRLDTLVNRSRNTGGGGTGWRAHERETRQEIDRIDHGVRAANTIITPEQDDHDAEMHAEGHIEIPQQIRRGRYRVGQLHIDMAEVARELQRANTTLVTQEDDLAAFRDRLTDTIRDDLMTRAAEERRIPVPIEEVIWNANTTGTGWNATPATARPGTVFTAEYRYAGPTGPTEPDTTGENSDVAGGESDE